MRILLLIIAGTFGLLNAYILGAIDRVDDQNSMDVEMALKLMGKKQLEEQKNYVYKMIRFSILINLPYLFLSLLYFFGNRIPFLLSIVLVLTHLLDIGLQIRKIKKANSIDEALESSKEMDKVLMFINMAIYAVHIAFLF